MEIKKKLEELHIPCSTLQEKALQEYMEGILSWNEKINLTAIKEEEEFIERHYIDSLTVCGEDSLIKAETIIDVGTGGGFPGVPLAIMFPEKNFTLLDSLNKRLKVIDELALKSGINNIVTLHGRAEDIGANESYREKFDLCVSRAVAELRVLAELCLPLVSVGGTFIAYKSANSDEEINAAKKAIKLLGGEISDIKNTSTNQKLVVISKFSATPKKYPRKAGEPKRKPL